MKPFWTVCLALSLALWMTGCSTSSSTQQESKPPAKPVVKPAAPDKGATNPVKTQEKPTKPAVC